MLQQCVEDPAHTERWLHNAGEFQRPCMTLALNITCTFMDDAVYIPSAVMCTCFLLLALVKRYHLLLQLHIRAIYHDDAASIPFYLLLKLQHFILVQAL